MGRLEDFKHSEESPLKKGTSLIERYFAVRKYSEFICEPLEIEDYVVQPVDDVSPPKWHLGHTTWFFEEIVLSKYLAGYRRFHARYAFIFNSYYEGVGDRILRADRGNLSRPTVSDVHEYRAHVDENMNTIFFSKDPRVIQEAYDDPRGVTASFNLNILTRLNRELGADFDLQQFTHYPYYDPETGAARSFLISMKEQSVYIEALGRSFHFSLWETIQTETSQKFSRSMINKLMAMSGLSIIEIFSDSDHYFCDVLARPR